MYRLTAEYLSLHTPPIPAYSYLLPPTSPLPTSSPYSSPSPYLTPPLPRRRDDIVRAVKKLAVLGSGVEVVVLGRAQYISAIPGELTMDHSALLQAAEGGRCVGVG